MLRYVSRLPAADSFDFDFLSIKNSFIGVLMKKGVQVDLEDFCANLQASVYEVK